MNSREFARDHSVHLRTVLRWLDRDQGWTHSPCLGVCFRVHELQIIPSTWVTLLGSWEGRDVCSRQLPAERTGLVDARGPCANVRAIKRNVREAVTLPSRIAVHTAPSGTQYVTLSDVLLNGETQREAKRLREVFSIGSHKGPKPDR